MSANDAPARREVAHRLFAAEFDDADYEYSESDEERAPNYVITPTGARVNRMFFVGVLTEVDSVSDDVLRARVVDPTGAFVIYAGQYQPDEMAMLERTDPPAFLAVTGKARTFQPDDSDRVFTSVRPESINVVDADTRDRWVVQTAEQTLERVATMARAKQTGLSGRTLEAALGESGVADSLAAGVPLALDHYGTTGEYLDAVRTLALDATHVVAGDRDEVTSLSVGPADGTDASLGELATVVPDVPEIDADVEPPTAEATAAGESAAEATASGETTADAAVDEGSAVDATAAGASTTDAGDVETASAETTSDVESSSDTDATEAESEPVEAESEPEPVDATSEPAEATSDAADDDLGDFEPGGMNSDTDEDVAAEPEADVAETDEMYEFDDEEREQIESEFGTEFSTGAEVAEDEDDLGDFDASGESAAETESEETTTGEPALESEPEEAEPEPEEAEAEPEAEPEEAETEPEAEPDEAPADDADLETVVVEEMQALNEGDGVERSALVDAVTDRTGADAGDVDDAISDALMSGECYETGDDVLMPI